MYKATNQQYILAAIILLASSIAESKDISYDFIQGTYESITDSSLPSGDVDGDAFSISGSFSIAPHLAISAGYGAASYDRFLGIDVDATELKIGLTAYTSVTPGTDVFGNFSVLKGEIEATDGFTTITDDDTGNVISIGLRHMATQNIELDIGLSRVDIFDDTYNTFGVGARFYASEKVSVGIGYATGDDVDTLSLNARIEFK